MRKAALIALALLAFTASGGATSTDGIARFREAEVSHRVVGVTETWRVRVQLQRQEKFIGTGIIACTYVEKNTSIRECVGTYVLPQGRIQVAGQIVNRIGFTLLIVGGSGVYDGARGTVVVTQTTDGPRRAFLTFYLT